MVQRKAAAGPEPPAGHVHASVGHQRVCPVAPLSTSTWCGSPVLPVRLIAPAPPRRAIVEEGAWWPAAAPTAAQETARCITNKGRHWRVQGWRGANHSPGRRRRRPGRECKASTRTHLPCAELACCRPPVRLIRCHRPAGAGRRSTSTAAGKGGGALAARQVCMLPHVVPHSAPPQPLPSPRPMTC